MPGKDFNTLNDMTHRAIARDGTGWLVDITKSKYERKEGSAINKTVIKRNFTSSDAEEYDLKLG
jgi:hypothetical protein